MYDFICLARKLKAQIQVKKVMALDQQLEKLWIVTLICLFR